MLRRDEHCIYVAPRDADSVRIFEVSIEWKYALGHGATFKSHCVCPFRRPFSCFRFENQRVNTLSCWSRTAYDISPRWKFSLGDVFWELVRNLSREYWRQNIRYFDLTVEMLIPCTRKSNYTRILLIILLLIILGISFQELKCRELCLTRIF